MGRPKRLKDIKKTPSAAVKAEWKPAVSETKTSLSSLPAELQLVLVHHLPCASLPTICQLNKHWCSVGHDELLRRLFPIPHRQYPGVGLVLQAIRHFIDTNNAEALQRLLEF